MAEIKEQYEEQKNRRLKLEEIAISIAENLFALPPEKIDEGIEEALKAIGEFVGVNRVGIFLLREDGKTVDCTHEWCAPGIPATKEGIQGVDCSVFPWFWSKLTDFEYVFIPQIEETPSEAIQLKKFYDSIGLKCSLDVPIIYKDKLFAFLGLSSTDTSPKWSEDDFNILRIIGQIFARDILRAKNSRK